MKELLIIIGLILLNGLFSMSETALISARKTRLREQSRKGSRSARLALQIAENPDGFLSTVQIGITLIGILTGLFSGATLAEDFANMLTQSGVPSSIAIDIAQTSIIVVVTFFSIVIGELVPKRVALNASDSVAKIVAPSMRLLSKISLPAVWLLSASTNLIIRILHLKDDENKTTEGDVKQIIESGAASGEVQQVEKEIMNRTLMLGDQRVSSIMTSRKDLITLNIDMNPAEIQDRIANNLHDTYPVLDEDGDETLGVVSLKDLIFKLQIEDFSLTKVLNKGVFIPESMTVYDALDRLKSDRLHSMLVCDEFGIMQGIVTSNDILDGLVGTEGESPARPYFLCREDGTYLVDAQCPIYDFLAYFDSSDLYQPANYTTLAGLILEKQRRVPNEGDKMQWGRFCFEIVDMDGARIDKLLVSILPPEQ